MARVLELAGLAVEVTAAGSSSRSDTGEDFVGEDGIFKDSVCGSTFSWPACEQSRGYAGGVGSDRVSGRRSFDGYGRFDGALRPVDNAVHAGVNMLALPSPGEDDPLPDCLSRRSASTTICRSSRPWSRSRQCGPPASRICC